MPIEKPVFNDKEIQLIEQAYKSGITNRKELAVFMAQCSVESGNFKTTQESFRYRDVERIKGVCSSMEKVPWQKLEDARLQAQKGNPEPLADLMYNSEYRANRMGNSAVGDGYKYSGKGYIQLTGKDNYEAMNKLLPADLNIDIVKNPEKVAEPELAAKTAILFWQNNVPAAARQDVTASTKIINGGVNGLSERIQRSNHYESLITEERLQNILAGKELPVLPTLKNGFRGDNVKELQEKLSKLGYLNEGGIDGIFGNQTKHAIKKFQEDYKDSHSLKVDGVANSQTQHALNKAVFIHEQTAAAKAYLTKSATTLEKVLSSLGNREEMMQLAKQIYQRPEAQNFLQELKGKVADNQNSMSKDAMAMNENRPMQDAQKDSEKMNENRQLQEKDKKQDLQSSSELMM